MRQTSVPAFTFIVSTICVAAFAVAAEGQPNKKATPVVDSWQPLFNGKDLTGWHVVLTSDLKGIDPEKVFQVHDGVIHTYQDVPEGAKVPIGYLASDNSYSWYQFKVEYRWVGKRFAPRVARPRDAGVLYHAAADKVVWPRSVECQIQENDVGDCFTVKGVQLKSTFDPAAMKSGVYKYVPAKDGGVAGTWGGPGISRIAKGSMHEVEGWNTVEIIVRGDEEVVYKVNDHEVFHATSIQQLEDDQKTWRPLKSGHLLLQCEFSEVMYRNAQIKPVEGGPFRVSDREKSDELAGRK